MSSELSSILTSIQHLEAIAIVLTIGLYGYAIYGTIVITRILHEIQRNTRRPERDEEAGA